jgi:hypothetical protein
MVGPRVAGAKRMVVETGIIVAGTGYAGSAVLRELARGNAPYILLDKAHGEMLYDVILSVDGTEVAGALVLRDGRLEPIRAPAVVLATGGIAGLLPGGDWRHSGDGLVIAHRAGIQLTQPLVDPERGLHASVPCKPDGATALKGFFVAGSLGSDRPDPAKLAKAAILRSRQGAPEMGPHHEHPTIDDPLPKGFTAVKFERLRAVCDKALRGSAPDPRALTELHRLKGEADEFARARTDAELFSLQNACEAALLLLRSA